MSAIGEANKKGSVDNNGEIANENTVNKGKNNRSEELEPYDDYYDNLEACDDGNIRVHRNAEFCHQLYEDMLVEDTFVDRHNSHVAAGKKAKKEGKWNRDLEIIADEDEERHREAHERVWITQLELYDGKQKLEVAKKALEKDWENVQYRC
jgi:alpha-glucuronidase